MACDRKQEKEVEIAAVNTTLLLKEHDDPVNWEWPDGFDYKAATAKFAAFVELLEVEFDAKLTLESGVKIQDASFHSQVFVSPAGSDRFVIRFSNFGEMVAINDDANVDSAVFQKLLKMFLDHGYNYIPSDVLNESYSGSNPGVDGIETWWIRFFDHV